MSTPAPTTPSVQQFLTKTRTTPMPHPTYLPEKVLKGKRFANVEEVKQKTAEALKGIKIDEFKNCFEQWKQHLNRCIA